MISSTNEAKTNPEITKKVESILLDIFSENENQSYPTKELEQLVKDKIDVTFKGVNILPHVSWALDMLHANSLIKKVAPGTWESVDGPDPVYVERSTGYAAPGEFARRGSNFTGTNGGSNRKEYNDQLKAAETSVKMLKRAGFSPKEVYDAMTKQESGTKFNPVAVKVMIKKAFSLPGIVDTNSDLDHNSDIDMSIFGNDIDIQK
jgi:hypothetical protein